eukprot:1146543-Pelagomonas_calceolata.AAC.2
MEFEDMMPEDATATATSTEPIQLPADTFTPGALLTVYSLTPYVSLCFACRQLQSVQAHFQILFGPSIMNRAPLCTERNVSDLQQDSKTQHMHTTHTRHFMWTLCAQRNVSDLQQDSKTQHVHTMCTRHFMWTLRAQRNVTFSRTARHYTCTLRTRHFMWTLRAQRNVSDLQQDSKTLHVDTACTRHYMCTL